MSYARANFPSCRAAQISAASQTKTPKADMTALTQTTAFTFCSYPLALAAKECESLALALPLPLRLRVGWFSAAVTPAAEPVAWVCVRVGGQLEAECCAQSQLVRSVLEHLEEGARLVRADRQVDLVAVDCEADAFGQAGRSVKPNRDVGSNVVRDLDAENKHCPCACPFSVLANAQERLVRTVEVPGVDHSSAGSTTSVQMKRGIAVDELSCLRSQSAPLMV